MSSAPASPDPELDPELNPELDLGDRPYYRQVAGGVLVGRGGKEIEVEAQDGIDLGAALIALGKEEVLRGSADWPEPREQRRLIAAGVRGQDQQLNFAELAALAEESSEGWRFAWELALVAIDSDHGRADYDGWSLVVGRSRRLELVLQLRQWAEDSGRKSELEFDLSYLHSRELEERLLSL